MPKPQSLPSPAAQIAIEHARVREVNQRFYQAVENLDLEAMDEIWLAGPGCRCIHPGWPALIGWESVRESWEKIFTAFHQIQVLVQQVHIQIDGHVAWLSCLEHVTTSNADTVETAVVCASNVFVRHEGEWKLTLHHASPVVGMEAPITDRLQ